MENSNAPVVRHPLFDFLSKNPQVLSAHANWLAAGGDKIIELLTETMSGDSFPWTAKRHVQASFGAFCGGGAFFGKTLKRLVSAVNNRNEALKILLQTDGSIPPAERDILLTQYGFSEKQLKDMEKKPARTGGKK